MRIFLLTFILCFSLGPLFGQLTLFRNGQAINQGQIITLKRGQVLNISAQLVTSDVDMDDIDRFPDDVGSWVDSTASGNTIIETFNWTVDEDVPFDFFDEGMVNEISFSVEVSGVETGIINADGSAQFSNVAVADTLDDSTAPFPGQLYRNSLPIAYGYINANGTIQSDYGILSVTNTATGEYEVKLEGTPIGYPVATVTPVSPVPYDAVATVSVGTNLDVIKVNLVHLGLAESQPFMIVVYGQLE